MKRWIPWMVTALLALWVVAGFRPLKSKQGFDTGAFGQLPALLNGRVQPLDSVARNALLQIRARQSVLLEKRKTMPATEWLLELMMKPEIADTRPVFRIDHPELLGMLELPQTNKFFSFIQLRPHLGDVQTQAQTVGEKEAQLRTPFERQVLNLFNAVLVYHSLRLSVQPEGTDDFAKELQKYRAAIGPGVEAVRANESGKQFDQAAFDNILQFLNGYDAMSRLAKKSPLLVPPTEPAANRDEWGNVGLSLLQTVHTGTIPPAIESYAAMSTAYRHDRPADFNRAVGEYRQWLQANLPGAARKGKFEFRFNSFQPFYKSMVIYVLAFVLACVFWVRWEPWLRQSAVMLVMLGLVVHTVGLIYRMALEGRPPVTNLYSSAIFIGWGAVILGSILERFYRDGIGVVTAAAIGFVTLVIAHNLALGGDTMEMLRAVLDTNFWLATHVTAVTIGYASTFVAGFLAILYVLRGVLSRSLTDTAARSLSRMVYGIICFATLFSFVGTVLGGIWADQSWGRFWGWDPKENGAVMIVIWNAAFLHARWGKILPERFLMALAVFGNVVTSFSWFGVNMLGIGLHAYGFMDQAFKWLLAFDIFQMLIIALAFVPTRYWLSFREDGTPPAGPGKATGPANRKRQPA